tara:strand:+ start:298 stop:1257 length:960 start_codon:yes stop_codon:yes gene_type:complete
MVKKIIIFLSCFMFASCSRPSYKNTYVISGTYLEVISPYPEAGNIVHEEFKRLDKVFSLYDPDSELFRLNSAYGGPYEVSEEMLEVLKLSKEINELTEGAFSVNCGSLFTFWKDLTKKGQVDEFPSPEEIEQLKMSCSNKYVELNLKKGTISIKRKDVRIDLGGIAKGYIVDKAVGKLRENGIDSALVNAGGDIYCLGKNKNRPWRAGIKDPKHPKQVLRSQDLRDEAIATSGNYEQFFEFDSRRYSHLINPKTGYPVTNNILSVSVIAKNCVIADSLATSFYIMGLEKTEEFTKQSPYDIKVYVVTDDGGGEEIHFFE